MVFDSPRPSQQCTITHDRCHEFLEEGTVREMNLKSLTVPPNTWGSCISSNQDTAYKRTLTHSLDIIISLLYVIICFFYLYICFSFYLSASLNITYSIFLFTSFSLYISLNLLIFLSFYEYPICPFFSLFIFIYLNLFIIFFLSLLIYYKYLVFFFIFIYPSYLFMSLSL